jgi:hypothetical protein
MGMSIDTALQRYFDTWNSHDPAQVVAALSDGGTYEDPTTGGPLSGDALAGNVDDIEGVMQFGISNRVETGRDTIPGAFTVTWIEIDAEQQMPLIDAATGVVMEQLGNEHYLGTCSPLSAVATTPSVPGPAPRPRRRRSAARPTQAR